MRAPKTGWWGRILVVLSKEVRDHLRDRRSLILALVYPLLGPLLLAGGLNYAGKTLEHRGEAMVAAPAIGTEHVPEIVELAARMNVHFVPAPSDPVDAVRRGDVKVVVVFPPEAETQERFTVTVYEDLTRLANVATTTRIKHAVELYNSKIAKTVTRSAGIADIDLKPVTIDAIAVGRDKNVAQYFYNLMPPLVIFMIFLSGVHLAIDTTAGERERGSLEPLLIAPIERWELLMAKALAAFLFTAVSVAINLATFRLLMGAAAATNVELAAPPGWGVFAAMFLISVPVMAVAVTLQMSISVITRSMKEAQIYLGLLPLVPALPGMIMVLAPIKVKLWNLSVPLLGQLQLFNVLVTGETPAFAGVMAATLGTLALAALVFWRAAKLFRRENLFFLG